MPTANIVIQETQESISRPIVFSIVDQVKKITRIDPDTPVMYFGDMDKNTQVNATLEDTNRESKFAAKNFIKVSVDEDFDEETILNTATGRIENPPIFHDPETGVYVKPIYANALVNINFKFYNISKTQIFQWYNDNRIKIAQMRDVNLHDITYHYPIPLVIMDLIADTYELKENVAGYGIDFSSYLKTYLTSKATILTSLNGKSREFAIAEKQMRIQGFFSFDPLPEKPDKEDGVELWSCTFNYKFTYSKPIGLNVIYPVMVHNQLLPAKYIDYSQDPYHLDEIQKSFSLSLGALNNFEIQDIEYKASGSDLVFRIPKLDTYIPTTTVVGTSGIFYALIVLDSDQTTLLDLHELDYLALDAEFIKFFEKVEYPYLCKPYQSVFNLSLYVGEAMLDYTKLNCSSSLIVSYTSQLSLRNNHRVRMSVYTDLSLVNKNAFDRLYGYSPDLFAKYINVVNKYVRGTENPIVDGKYINNLYRIITGRPLIPGDLLDINNPYSNYNNINTNYGNTYMKNYPGLYGTGRSILGIDDIGFKTVMSSGILTISSEVK